MATIVVRPARTADLAALHEIVYRNDTKDERTPPTLGDVPPELPHILRTGTMVVAERNGRVLGFASSIVRGRFCYLTDLFIDPDEQSAGVGKRLLLEVWPAGDVPRATCSSTDPRALALYVRSGMQPRWPHINLQAEHTPNLRASGGALEAVVADAGDPALLEWDERIGGRPRRAEHAFWVEAHAATPLWFKRTGKVVGYGYVRPGTGTLFTPEACSIGPVGAARAEDATDCVLAAVQWATRFERPLLIDVPGPHPAFAPLLEAGFRISYVETFASTSEHLPFDPRCYVASDSTLF